MPSREEIAATVAKEIDINEHAEVLTMGESGYKRIWDALISAKVELAEREQKLERYKNALHGHLCGNDVADWLACTYGSHFGESGEIYCDVCAGESPDPEHPHPMLRKVTEKLADSEQRVKELSEALRGFLREAESWHTMHDHDGKGCVQCDSICALIPGARAVLSEGEKR